MNCSFRLASETANYSCGPQALGSPRGSVVSVEDSPSLFMKFLLLITMAAIPSLVSLARSHTRLIKTKLSTESRALVQFSCCVFKSIMQ